MNARPSTPPQSALPPTQPPDAWTLAEATIEASRCLYCHEAPCSLACPAGVDVAEFVRSIRTGALRSAARLVLAANALGESCGCVCPTETLCEGECVLARLDQRPIAIGRLQRFALHWARAGGWRPFAAAPPAGKRVALVGAGPASLACAYELARLGHRPVVFERAKLPGGLNRTAIAPHKMSGALPLTEAEWLLGAGVEVRYGITAGRDISFAELGRDFDAIFLGVGLGPDRRLGVPGEEAEGVIGALEMLERIKSGETEPGFRSAEADGAPWSPPPDWKRVLVVGGGNSAIDAARALKDLGVPDVVLVYRRAEDRMKGYVHEWRAAKAAGVAAAFHTQPVEVLVADGRVRGLRCIRMAPGPPDESGRPRPVAVPGSEHDLEADAIAVAIGQAGEANSLPGLPEGIRMARGRIVVSPATGETGRSGWFAGGDCVSGGAEVVHAAAAGMRAARAIARCLADKEDRPGAARI